MALITIVGGSTADSYVSLIEANSYIASRPDSKNWNDSDYLERERLLRQATIDLDILRFKGNKLFQGGEGNVFGTILTSSIFDVLYNGYQSLQFPRDWHEYYTGYADSGSTTTLIDTTFTELAREDNYFKYGSIYILSGTNKGEYRNITGYVTSTGTFTTVAFTNAIDTTSQYLILAPIDKYIKYAVIEQGLHLANNLELSKFQEWKNSGIIARSIGDVSIRFDVGTRSLDCVGGMVATHAFRYIQKFINRCVGMGRG